MRLADPPARAAWWHRGLRSGHEVAFLEPYASGAARGVRMRGTTTAVEDGVAWAFSYDIVVDDAWRTRRARLGSLSEVGAREVVLTADGAGSWQVDGVDAPHLAGCVDLDLEASVLTNTLPLHRLGLEPLAPQEVPAVFVPAVDPAIERLDQAYMLGHQPGVVRYEAPAYGARFDLEVDDAGLVLRYPDLAERYL